jgi:hypothetical protein
MATNSVTLRPYADVSVGHDIQDGFSGVYQLINEVSPDDDTTYIGSYVKSEAVEPTVSSTSIVKLDVSAIPESVKLTNITLFLRAHLS